MYPHQHIHLDGEPANRILRKSANIKLYTILDPKKKKKCKYFNTKHNLQKIINYSFFSTINLFF